MSNPIKQIRGQLRQIVQELLPSIITEALFKEIQKSVKAQLDVIEKRHKESLDKMQTHQRETLSYLTRQLTTPVRTENETK